MKRSLTLLLLFVIPAFLIASPPQKMIKKRMVHSGKAGACEALKLTDEQQAKMHDLKIGFQKRMIPVESQLKLARIELEELIREDVSGRKLDAAVEKVNELRSQLFKLRIDQRLEVRKLLTDEQKKHLRHCKHFHHLGGHSALGMRAGPGCRDRDVEEIIIREPGE